MGCLVSKAELRNEEADKAAAQLDYMVPSGCLFLDSAEGSARLWDPKSIESFFKYAQPREISQLDIFVSHCWLDKTYIAARGEAFYWDIKTTGVIKASKQLVQRNIAALQDRDLKEWRVWVDRACVDQANNHMKTHATETFDDYIKACKALVVLLSPDYLSRLWCVFEFSCFLAFHSMNEVSIYTWAFMDSPDTAGHMVHCMRNLSVSSCQCAFESDRETLVSKVAELYQSEQAFERFAKFCGIAMITHSLFVSPAVFSDDRARSFLVPWSALARELGFEDLAKVLEGWPVVENYLKVQSQAPPDQNSAWGQVVQEFVGQKIMPLVESERKFALKGLI